MNATAGSVEEPGTPRSDDPHAYSALERMAFIDCFGLLGNMAQ